jgi:hypothetical protein
MQRQRLCQPLALQGSFSPRGCTAAGRLPPHAGQRGRRQGRRTRRGLLQSLDLGGVLVAQRAQLALQRGGARDGLLQLPLHALQRKGTVQR